MRLHINQTEHRLTVDPDRSLLSILRDELGLTGSKYGCGEGECGACTVLIDGHPVRSCITPVGALGTARVTTIEGLGTPEALHPVQQAFLDDDALQCGYCTPGMIMSAAGLLAGNPSPSREQIVRAMNGNLCRCGTYQRIIAAIERAAEAMREGS